MISWKTLDSISGVDTIIKDSYIVPQLIFKHSTTCSISGMAKRRLETDWDVGGLEPYYLDLLNHREVSNYIAEKLSVHHESPQVILIDKGEAFHDVSHLDISIPEIKEVLDYHKANG